MSKDEELEQLYNEPSIKNMLYAKRIEWTGHKNEPTGKLWKMWRWTENGHVEGPNSGVQGNTRNKGGKWIQKIKRLL